MVGCFFSKMNSKNHFESLLGRSAIGFKIYEMQCRLPKWQVPSEMDRFLVVLGGGYTQVGMDGWMDGWMGCF